MMTEEKNKAQLSEVAAELLNETKKYARDAYESGLKKVDLTQDDVKEYSDELLEKVKQHPLKAILIAGAAGMILSALIRK